MRAIFLKKSENLKNGDILNIDGDRAHHLLKAVRIKLGEYLLIFNGSGLKITAKVSEVKRRELNLDILEVSHESRQTPLLDIAFCLPKKNALDEILKISVELGLNTITPLFSEYSSRYDLNKERIDRLLESALIQSNNPFLPIMNKGRDLKALDSLCRDYDRAFYFSSIKKVNGSITFQNEVEKVLLIIGPEGGLSGLEEDFIENIDNVNTVHLPTPILRAPHALATSVGYLLGLFQK
ncbi:16S rRNA (uracil(1498)-N(3))-methyltransferase [Bacteriovoracales bacterium]|nr:16S rRNA (uracil(1498)-N(3))-methyltransferase [Bacteriovoracales bacterium]